MKYTRVQTRKILKILFKIYVFSISKIGILGKKA